MTREAGSHEGGPATASGVASPGSSPGGEPRSATATVPAHLAPAEWHLQRACQEPPDQEGIGHERRRDGRDPAQPRPRSGPPPLRLVDESQCRRGFGQFLAATRLVLHDGDDEAGIEGANAEEAGGAEALLGLRRHRVTVSEELVRRLDRLFEAKVCECRV